jgi:hypothetical protein
MPTTLDLLIKTQTIVYHRCAHEVGVSQKLLSFIRVGGFSDVGCLCGACQTLPKSWEGMSDIVFSLLCLVRHCLCGACQTLPSLMSFCAISRRAVAGAASCLLSRALVWCDRWLSMVSECGVCVSGVTMPHYLSLVSGCRWRSIGIRPTKLCVLSLKSR